MQQFKYEDSIKVLCDYELKIKSELIDKDSLKLACLSEFYLVTFDDSIQINPKWHFYENHQTQQKGIVSWIDISRLEDGEHIVQCKANLPEKGPISFSEIDFIKDVH